LPGAGAAFSIGDQPQREAISPSTSTARDVGTSQVDTLPVLDRQHYLGPASDVETTKPNGQIITGSVQLINAVGMHASPAVKLTKLAKKFQAHVTIRPSDAAEWINAKR